MEAAVVGTIHYSGLSPGWIVGACWLFFLLTVPFILAKRLGAKRIPAMWAAVAVTMAFSIGGAGAGFVLSRGKVEGRHLNHEQQAALIAALSPFSEMRVRISHAATTDCAGYAADFSRVFGEAGWTMMRRELLTLPDSPTTKFDEPRYGLYVLCNNTGNLLTKACEPIESAMRRYDIEYGGAWMTYGTDEPEIEIRIYPSPYGSPSSSAP